MRALLFSLLCSLTVIGCATDAGSDKGALDNDPPGDTSEIVQGCRRTGCSGQVCADHTVFTTCEWKEIYACYASATCTRQPGGACGWTPTPELQQCLASGGGI